MVNKFSELKEKALSTEVSKWWRFKSTVSLAVMCLGMVAYFWYLLVTMDALYCYKGFVYMTVVWIVAELTLIGYMFRSNSIPRFVRSSLELVLSSSNLWFGLFLFSLNACSN